MTRVVYIMGAGRTGSTILGVVLGNCEHHFYAGELETWLRSCGRPAYPTSETETFWRSVNARLQDYGDLCGETCLRCFEHSTALFRPGSRFRTRRLHQRYRRFNRALYDSVAAASGSDVIIDSSHYPLRARELRRIAGIEIHLILLVRDERAVVNSLTGISGPGDKSFWAANLYLWLTHGLSSLVFLTHPKSRRVFVRYESLVANPAGTVRDILDAFETPSALPDFASLHTGRPLAGNRVLASERVAFTPTNPPPAQSGPSATAVIQLAWTLLFAWLQRSPTRRAGQLPPDQREAVVTR